jgi:protein TilB
MVRITAELLRRRAEHNLGELSNLEEVTLHQFEIEKIENLDKLCRHLKILYLQNNIIGKMENLNRMKELEYLNLALNNISRIENIERCESLNKLDLTLNFVDLDDLDSSCECLAKVHTLQQLYLSGNPCTSWSGYRPYVVARVPHLRQLDGVDITPTERLAAMQQLEQLRTQLVGAAEEAIAQRASLTPEQRAHAYTKESRIEQAREAEQIRQEKEHKTVNEDSDWYGTKPRRGPLSVYNVRGDIRQANEGGYKFSIKELFTPELQWIVLDLAVPRYMETSLLNVDLHPQYVRIDIKGKIFQLKFLCEVSVEESEVQRSLTTGHLVIKMPKVENTLTPFYNLIEEVTPIKPEPLPLLRPAHRLLMPDEKLDFVDDPDVPPLE